MVQQWRELRRDYQRSVQPVRLPEDCQNHRDGVFVVLRILQCFDDDFRTNTCGIAHADSDPNSILCLCHLNTSSKEFDPCGWLCGRSAGNAQSSTSNASCPTMPPLVIISVFCIGRRESSRVRPKGMPMPWNQVRGRGFHPERIATSRRP